MSLKNQQESRDYLLRYIEELKLGWPKAYKFIANEITDNPYSDELDLLMDFNNFVRKNVKELETAFTVLEQKEHILDSFFYYKSIDNK